MTEQLRLLVLAVWASIHPVLPRSSDANTIASAIATVIAEDGKNAPVFTSHVEDAAVMAYWAYRESSLRLHVTGDGGKSFGFLQLRTPAAHGDPVSQARSWLYMLHAGKRMCTASEGAPGAVMWGGCALHVKQYTTADLAEGRLTRARELLMSVMESSYD
jgi:hypothetical protein